MIRAVLRKELVTLWVSPLPYVVGVVFHVTAGLLFVNQLEGRRQAVLQPMFPIAGFLLVALLPLLAMRTLADEQRSGNLDLLLSAGARARSIVTGKWLATWATAIAVVAPSIVLPLLVGSWGSPDWGPVATGYVGLALLAGGGAAIGVLASSLTSTQPVAAAVAFFAGLLLWFSSSAPDATTAGGGLLARLSLSERMRAFAGGAVDSADAGYFVVLTIACIAAAVAVVGSRRYE